MSLLDTLSAFFSRPAEETANETPEGSCPNCWGRYEYDGEIRQVARDRQIDVDSGRERYAFIQEFVVKHIDGIRLRDNGKGRVCPQVRRPAPLTGGPPAVLRSQRASERIFEKEQRVR